MCRAIDHGGRRCETSKYSAADKSRRHAAALRERENAYTAIPYEKWKHNAAQKTARTGIPNPLEGISTRDLHNMTEEERNNLFKNLPDDQNPSLRLRDRYEKTEDILVEQAVTHLPTAHASAFEDVARNLVANMRKQTAEELLGVVMVGLDRFCGQTGTTPDDYDIPGIAKELSKRTREFAAMTEGERHAAFDETFARNFIPERLGQIHREARLALAHSPALAGDLLRQLANDKDGYIRSAVAKNPSTPVAALHNLASDADRDVREGVAMNASTSVETLRGLTADSRLHVESNPQVLKVVAERQVTPGLALTGLLNDFTAEQYEQFRDAPAEWLDSLASGAR